MFRLCCIITPCGTIRNQTFRHRLRLIQPSKRLRTPEKRESSLHQPLKLSDLVFIHIRQTCMNVSLVAVKEDKIVRGMMYQPSILPKETFKLMHNFENLPKSLKFEILFDTSLDRSACTRSGTLQDRYKVRFLNCVLHFIQLFRVL